MSEGRIGAIVLVCHSERAFGRGRIPTSWVKVLFVKILSTIKHDSPNEYAGFFTLFRMTCRVGFVDSNESSFYCHSERAFWARKNPYGVGVGSSNENFIVF